MKSIRLLGAIACATFVLLPAQAADALADAARKIFTDKQDAVIWVSAVTKISFAAEGARDQSLNLPDQERKVETLGTIIGTNGLIVTALTQLDPTREISGREFRTEAGMVKIEAIANIKECRVIMADGTEIPAEVVMKDADLDLAFVRIKTASKEARGVEFKALDLKASGKVRVSDDTITLSRVDEVLSRVASVTRGQVMSITLKPREFIRASGATLGCPTFLPDGKLLGIGVTRSMRGKQPQPVVIPAADVLEIAEQAGKVAPAPAPPAKTDSE